MIAIRDEGLRKQAVRAVPANVTCCRHVNPGEIIATLETTGVLGVVIDGSSVSPELGDTLLAARARRRLIGAVAVWPRSQVAGRNNRVDGWATQNAGGVDTRDFWPCIRRSLAIAVLDILLEQVVELLGTNDPLSRALSSAINLRPLSRNVHALTTAAGRSHSTLATRWRDVSDSAAGVDLHTVVAWILLLRMLGDKPRHIGLQSLANSAGVGRSRLWRISVRLTGHPFGEIESSAFLRALQTFDSTVLEAVGGSFKLASLPLGDLNVRRCAEPAAIPRNETIGTEDWCRDH